MKMKNLSPIERKAYEEYLRGNMGLADYLRIKFKEDKRKYEEENAEQMIIQGIQ